jgi:hypothetical protein
MVRMRPMHLRLTKPWHELSPHAIRDIPGQLGVYELATVTGETVYIGYAGGRELFGLRSALQRHFELGTTHATKFRYEVNMQYQSRHRELLMLHVADHGALPAANLDDHPIGLGKMR